MTTVPAEEVGSVFARVQDFAQTLSPMEALGEAVYFDKTLSLHRNQSCASCHDPAFGFSGPNPGVNLRGAVYMGSVKNRFGNRRPPSAAYATQSPVLHFDAGDDVWVGGNFWDGRATGETLGFPAAEQALGPFLNPVEQALPDEICVLYRIARGPYADLWEEVWAEDLRDLDFPGGLERACRREGSIEYGESLRGEVVAAYDRVGLSINAFEASAAVNAFSSKFDAVMAGEAAFTAMEALGQELFNGKGQCNLCHISEGPGALFTDYTYDNLGVPANPLNPAYPDFVDQGIGGFLDEPGLYGAVKVPTLRNVAKAPGAAVKSYGHNGVFKSLEQIVHFYNTRDSLEKCAPGEVLPTPAGLAKMGFEPACWPAPEVPENVNVDELGDLGLTRDEEKAIVAFMETLSDGWRGR
ncbi:MAG: cytochrome c peroxidase [Gemmatimonadota bacterium]